jgi:hypothetical protein
MDMGILRYEKRLQQTAADAAALAGASNLCKGANCGAYGGVIKDLQRLCQGVSPNDEPCDFPALHHMR